MHDDFSYLSESPDGYYFVGGVFQLDNALVAGLAGVVQGFMDVHVEGFGMVAIVLIGVLHDAGGTQGHQA